MYTLITEVLFLFVTNLIPYFILIKRHLVPSRSVKCFFMTAKSSINSLQILLQSAYYAPMFFYLSVINTKFPANIFKCHAVLTFIING
jgi:hypothetical protein